MKVKRPCKRGNISERDKYGSCLCADCKEFRATRSKETRRPGYQKEWQEANREKCRTYNAKWIDKNPDKRKAAVASWCERNAEKVAIMNSKSGKKWYASNKGATLARVRARQLAKKMRTPLWADRDEMAKTYREAARRTEETGIHHEVDHIIPLQGETVSGLHVPNNLQILSRFANRSKGIKLCEN